MQQGGRFLNNDDGLATILNYLPGCKDCVYYNINNNDNAD